MPDQDLPLDNPNPTAFPASFDAAVRDGGYTSGDGMWNAYVNRDVLSVFGEDAWLDRAAIVRDYAVVMRCRFARYQGQPDQPRTWADAGNMIHHALRLGLVREETGPDGERGWRILSKEPHWIIEGTGYARRLSQVRGLPPEEQATQDKREATARKLSATLDRKARFKADEVIARYVREILSGDPSYLVHERWALQDWIPRWLPGTRLDACAPTIREAHHAAEMDRPTLKRWLSSLRIAALGAREQAIARQILLSRLPEHIDIPEDDAASLGALA